MSLNKDLIGSTANARNFDIWYSPKQTQKYRRVETEPKQNHSEWILLVGSPLSIMKQKGIGGNFFLETL